MKKVFLICGLVMSSLFGCKQADMAEIKQTAAPAELLINSISELYSTYDVLDDFISNSELLGKKGESLIPNSVLITILDGTYSDGDGVEVSLDFGPLKQEAPHGVLCKDNKYRAGVIVLRLDKKYSEVDARLEIAFDSSKPFYSGNGSQMMKFVGGLVVEKLGDNSLFLESEELMLESDDFGAMHFECNNTVVKTVDNGKGIYDDEITVDGNYQIKDDQGNKFSASIEESLEKDYQAGCIRNIVSGVLNITENYNASSISVDYDVYGDKACDALVEITINGKSSLYEVK